MARTIITVALAAALALPATAGDLSKQVIRVSDTKTLDAVTGGTLRFENSRGGVSIEGWEKPQVEITIVKSTTGLYDPKHQDAATRMLDGARVTSEASNEVIAIETNIPRKNRNRVRIDYLVKAPRGMKIEVGHHAEGDVSVTGMSGDIEATTRRGQVTIVPSEDAHYTIDARAGFGDVYSDFDGQDKRRHVLHHDFDGGETAGKAAEAEHRMLLRDGSGDIVILKTHTIRMR